MDAFVIVIASITFMVMVINIAHFLESKLENKDDSKK